MVELTPSMPEVERATLARSYAAADVILEYGSGGSTMMAAAMAGKLIFSVESDWRWAAIVQHRIDTGGCPSPAVVYHADIGRTGLWGIPLDTSRWRDFHRYPLAIWDEPFFRQPDTALVDGRFRTACLLAIALRTQRPVTVLFDDYTIRDRYKVVERFLGAPAVFGRMARFEVDPGMLTPDAMPAVIAEFFACKMIDDGID